MKQLLIIITLIFCSGLAVNAQNATKEDIRTINTEITTLKNTDIRNLWKDLNNEIEKNKELKERITEYEKTGYKVEQLEKDLKFWLYCFAGIAGFLGLSSFLGIKGAYNKANKKAEDLVSSEIADIITREKDKIIEIVKSNDVDIIVKKESKVLVVSKSSADNEAIKKILKNYDLNEDNIQYRVHKNYADADSPFNVFLLNMLDDDMVKAYIKQGNKDAAYVAYINEGFLTPHDRLNFSKNPITLYSNLLNTLKYQYLQKNA